MPAKLIKGEELIAKLREDKARQLQDLYAKTNKVPGLAVIIVGENPASLSYVASKQKRSESLGFYSEIRRLPEDTTQEELLKVIDELNEDNKIHGFMLQLPLPEHLDTHEALEAIDPEKDVEGANPVNMGKLFSDEEGFLPCTAYSIMLMIEHTREPVRGKSAVIIGRSNIVGKPLSLLLLRRNASVTICHSRTENLSEICSKADILVSATGEPGLVKGDWVKPGATVIDVGVSQLEDKLVGDVAFEEVEEVAGWISPVPGGVGPITITVLMKNTLEAFKQRMGT